MRKLALVSLVLLLFGCDHATKLAARETLAHGPPVNVMQLHYVENRDVAFSLFRSLGWDFPSRAPRAILPVVAVAVVLLLVTWWRMRRDGSFLLHAGFATVVAGALGNLVDRVLRGYVVDFVHVRGWPVFNVADAAVVLGAFALLIALRRRSRSSRYPRPSTCT
jgi:signal peptidase II